MAGIYIHIPFCKQRCGYCDFFSTTDLGLREKTLAAIAGELRRRKGFLAGAPVTTLYIGGGTPSLCSPSEIGMLADTVRREYGVADFEEFTVEANPDDLSAGYLAGLREAGAGRLSIGIQSFVDRDLRFMNRRHSARQAVEAVGLAQAAGFGDISIDLIYGVPGMSAEEWRSNLETAVSLGVQHISAYHLGIEEGTPFGRLAGRGELSPVDESESGEQYAELCRVLAGAGFEHYEVSNFALPGRRAVHNGNYWKGEAYLGVGPSAHSFDGRRRQWNAASMGDYLGGAGGGCEVLDWRDRYNEMVMLSLRTSDGLDAGRIAIDFGPEAAEEFRRTAETQVERGLMVADGGRYRIPADRFLVSDAIISDFFKE